MTSNDGRYAQKIRSAVTRNAELVTTGRHDVRVSSDSCLFGHQSTAARDGPSHRERFSGVTITGCATRRATFLSLNIALPTGGHKTDALALWQCRNDKKQARSTVSARARVDRWSMTEPSRRHAIICDRRWNGRQLAANSAEWLLRMVRLRTREARMERELPEGRYSSGTQRRAMRNFKARGAFRAW